MSFWPTQDHWSVKIPLDTDHYRMDALAADGFVELRPMPVDVPQSEWESVEYMDWKSGGDTNFAPLASADGELDCRGFWDKGKTDKDALWTSNAELTPTLRAYVDAVGANFGRVRLIKLEPQDRDTAIPSIHRDDNNRFNPEGEGWVVRTWVELTDNPDSYMLLMDSGARRSARPGDRAPRAAQQGCSLRRRHPTPVARGRAQRRRAPLRPHHQLRVGPDARSVDRPRARPGAGLVRVLRGAVRLGEIDDVVHQLAELEVLRGVDGGDAAGEQSRGGRPRG